MFVRLLVPYFNCKPGDVIDLPATEARQLIEDFKAHGGNIDISNVKPVDYSTPTITKPVESVRVVIPQPKKPGPDNTVKEIKAYLDKKGIEYPVRAKKDELLKLI